MESNLSYATLDDSLEAKGSRPTGAVRVYQRLREAILCMRLRPGEPLDELGLSQQFRMSRSPVREALVRLASEGLVVALPNRSTVVAPMDLQGIPHFLDALHLLQAVTHRLAALQRTDEQLKAMKAAQRAYEKAVVSSFKSDDSLPMIEGNHRFHMAIARASNNPYFVAFYGRLMDEGRRMLFLFFKYKAEMPTVKVEDLIADHLEMLQAIEAKDADRAEGLAREHAAQFRGRFMHYLNRNLTAGIELGDGKAANSDVR